MRSYFARMFLLLVLSVATGCVSTQYENDSVSANAQVGGFVRSSSTPVQVQMRNRLTNNWDIVAYRDPELDVAFWFTSYKLYVWDFGFRPGDLTSRYRSSTGWVEMRFMQGTTLLMTFDRSQVTTPYVTSPESCVWAEYGQPEYVNGTDYYLDADGVRHVLRQQPFTDCGLVTASGADGILRLRVN